MISRILLVATAVALTGCSDATAPNQLEQAHPSAAASPRSGDLHVTKECSTYTGRAGDICTITSSNIEQIEPGSTVTYASDAVGASLDTDVRLDPPGPGNNAAFGHCALDLATGIGACTFSGGTGKFTWFHATIAVSYLGGPNFAWDGSYGFSPGG